MITIKILDKNTISQRLICDFFRKVNYLFDPNLKNRISNKSGISSFEEYAEKVLSTGSCLSVIKNNSIQALLILYHNNIETKEAVIPVLSVLPECNGKGMASTLIVKAKEISKESLMKKINVSTWPSNQAAISLYRKHGFEVFSIIEDNVDLSFEFNE